MRVVSTDVTVYCVGMKPGRLYSGNIVLTRRQNVQRAITSLGPSPTRAEVVQVLDHWAHRCIHCGQEFADSKTTDVHEKGHEGDVVEIPKQQTD